jgi:hypothetical protein
MPQPKVSRILFEDRRIEKCTEEPARDLVGISGPETLSVAFSALALLFELAIRLADSCLSGSDNNRHRIERGLGEQFELLAGFQRRSVHAIRGTKSWHDAKCTFRLLLPRRGSLRFGFALRRCLWQRTTEPSACSDFCVFPPAMKFCPPPREPDLVQKRKPQAAPMRPHQVPNESQVFSRPYPSTFRSTVTERDHQLLH